MSKLTIKPISLEKANEYIIVHHRHHHKVNGHKYSLACYDGERLCGVACVGRPAARKLDNGDVLEVTRLCTDGTYNACSLLYSRCARVAKEMGYKKIITYILENENGVSLKASGWHCELEKAGGGSWNSKSRPREIEITNIFGTITKYPIVEKQRWAKDLNI